MFNTGSRTTALSFVGGIRGNARQNGTGVGGGPGAGRPQAGAAGWVDTLLYMTFIVGSYRKSLKLRHFQLAPFAHPRL